MVNGNLPEHVVEMDGADVRWKTKTEVFDFLICRESEVDDDPNKASGNAVASAHTIAQALDRALRLTIEHGEPFVVLRYDITRMATLVPVIREEVAS